MLLDLFLLNVFLMLCSWVLATYNHRAGIVDVTWSFGIALNVLIAATMMTEAPAMIRVFLAIGSGLWFMRLTWHLLRRYLHETEEDTRYANMRRAMRRYQHVGFLVFFLFQAGLISIFSYPMLKLLSFSVDQWNTNMLAVVIAAAFIMVTAFIGETIADQQLYTFKRNPNHVGQTMDQGLWKYSRHPNYFFEWLHWFAYPVLGLAVGAYGLWMYPVLMWVSLYYITGIPFSEQQALAHRGENYKDYQMRTSMFIPWPPKK